MSDGEPIGAEEKVIDLEALEMDEKGDDNLVLSRLLKRPNWRRVLLKSMSNQR